MKNRNSNFSFTKRLQSYKYAFNGIKIIIKEEHNARIHLLAALLAIVLSAILKINTTEWIVIVCCIGAVFITEIVNSTIENLCDFISTENHEMIKRIKDLSAAAVLMAAIITTIIACLMFIPKI